MAALDFGMALARGMLPKAETAQKDLINLAGGRNIFKSEDWWNKAVDEQIKSGYRELERTGKEYLMPSGEYKREKTQTSSSIQRDALGRITSFGGINPGVYYASIDPVWGRFSGGGGGVPLGTSTSYVAPEGAVFTLDPRTKEKQYTTREIDIFKTTREDFTAGELSDITASAKRGAEQAKRIAAESKATRKKRGTGGVLAKARIEGEAPATGLPALGEGGLGITGSILGGGIKL